MLLNRIHQQTQLKNNLQRELLRIANERANSEHVVTFKAFTRTWAYVDKIYKHTYDIHVIYRHTHLIYILRFMYFFNVCVCV